MSSYCVPAALQRCAIEVKRSRFIATVQAVPDRAAAELALINVRREMPDATHHAYAYIAGAPGGTGDIACSDDGEVAGTAGRPLLNLLQHSGLGEVLLVVSRYYGGTLLGTGGLLRAYSDAGRAALEAVVRVPKQIGFALQLSFDYMFEADVRRVLLTHNAVIAEVVYNEHVVLQCVVAKDLSERLLSELNNLTRGKLLFFKPVS